MLGKGCVKQLCQQIGRKCHKLSEFSYQTKAKVVNTKAMERHNIKLASSKGTKEKFGFDPYAILPLKGSDEFQDIRKQIFHAKDGKSIRKLLKTNLKTSGIKYDLSVFTAAITKCGEIGDVESCIKIINTMYKKKISRDLNVYNILFRAFALNEKAYQYPSYLDNMVNKDKISPDIVTATILIGGCKLRGDIDLAQDIWNNIIIKFKLEPTDITYIQMLSVYATAAEPHKAQKTFKEMMEKGIRPNHQSCGALMQCFSNCMDINNVIKIKQFMELKGIKLDSYHYRSLIAVYLKNRLPLKALEIYNEYINKLNGDIPHESIVGFKNHIFKVLLEDNVNKGIDDKNTEHYYNMITKTNLDEIKGWFGSKSVVINRLKYNLLESNILYHDTLKGDKKKATEIFKNICDKYKIGYWTKMDKTGKWILDFHSFGYIATKFLLEYLFIYEKDNILEMDEVLILCGRGYHRDKYSSDNRHPDERGIMWFIQNELSLWSPIPIRSQKCQDNFAVLRLFREDVIAYFETQQQCTNDNQRNHKIYGNLQRKKLSQKYLNELKQNLIEGRKIEIWNEEDQWEQFIVNNHIEKANFMVVNVKSNEEITLNFKCLQYRMFDDRPL